MRSCVQLTHTPTGISISCQDTRSLEQNRRLARRGLAEKVEFEEKGAESKRGRKIEKVDHAPAEGAADTRADTADQKRACSVACVGSSSCCCGNTHSDTM